MIICSRSTRKSLFGACIWRGTAGIFEFPRFVDHSLPYKLPIMTEVLEEIAPIYVDIEVFACKDRNAPMYAYPNTCVHASACIRFARVRWTA